MINSHHQEIPFQFLVENAIDITTVIDPTGRIIFCSPSVKELLGYQPNELEGLSALEFVHPDDRQRVAHMMVNGFDAIGTHCKLTFRHRAKNGGWRYLESIGSAHQLGNKENVIGVVNSRDITDVMELEAEKAELEEHLRRVSKLEAVSSLSGGLAHDFNNYLQVILTSLETAQHQLGCGHPAQQDLARIEKSASGARDLVARILKIGSRMEGDPSWQDLGDLVQEAKELFRPHITSKVKVAIDVQPDLPKLWADPVLIRQIIQNLWKNALEALDGRGNIRISVTAIDGTNSPDPSHDYTFYKPCIQLQFEDDGQGMDAVTKSRVFDPFFTRKKRSHGTGLGLSLVHSIVDLLEGSISVQSELGQGSTFTVSLPALNQSAPQTKISNGYTHPGKAASILIVDRDFKPWEPIRGALTGLGYQVFAVGCMAEAKALLADPSSPFDVLVTDYCLGTGTGCGLAREIHKTHPQIRTILVTSSGDENLVNETDFPRIDAFLVKPVKSLDLEQTIRQVLADYQN